MKNIFLVVVGFCSILSVSKAQVNHYSTLNIENDNDFSGFEMLDTVVGKYSVFFTGENHRYTIGNSRTELKFLRYLNQKVGVTNYLLELGTSRGYLLNKYINTGDTLTLNCLKATTGKKYLDFYKQLRATNEKLPDSFKIKVTGIDVERFADMPIAMLNYLLPLTPAPKELELEADVIKTMFGYLLKRNEEQSEEKGQDKGYVDNYYTRSYPYFYESKTSRLIIEHYDSLKPFYKEWIGANFELFNNTINSLRKYFIYEGYENTPYSIQYRENELFRNATEYIQSHPGEKFYGQFGRCHISLIVQDKDCYWFNYHPLAEKLNAHPESIVKNKVLSIAILYAQTDDFENELTQKELKPFIQVAEAESLTLFNIITSKENKYIGSFYQYLIINNKYSENGELYDTIVLKKKRDGDFLDAYHMGYSYMQAKSNLNNVNALLPAGISFNEQLYYNVIQSGNISKLDRTNTFMNIGWVSPITKYFGGDSSVRFSAFRTTVESGFDAFPNQNNIHWLFTFGFGYGNYKLTSGVKQSSFDFTKPSTSQFVTYKNPAFLGTVGTSFIINIFKIIGLGVQAGYAHDFSNKKWRYKGRLIDNSASASLGGFYVASGIYLVIKS